VRRGILSGGKENVFSVAAWDTSTKNPQHKTLFALNDSTCVASD